MMRQGSIGERVKALHRAALVKGCIGLFLAGIGSGLALTSSALAQQEVPLGGLQLSGSKDPVQIDADRLEMRDRDGTAIFTGNVSVVQGPVMLKAGKMQVFYSKSNEKSSDDASSGKAATDSIGGAGLGASGIERLEVDGKVYLKSGTQVATGDAGVFDAKTQTIVLTGKKVVLSDGDNIATGCKLTANTQTGKAFLESCKGSSGRVSIILSPNK